MVSRVKHIAIAKAKVTATKRACCDSAFSTISKSESFNKAASGGVTPIATEMNAPMPCERKKNSNMLYSANHLSHTPQVGIAHIIPLSELGRTIQIIMRLPVFVVRKHYTRTPHLNPALRPECTRCWRLAIVIGRVVGPVA